MAICPVRHNQSCRGVAACPLCLEKRTSWIYEYTPWMSAARDYASPWQPERDHVLGQRVVDGGLEGGAGRNKAAGHQPVAQPVVAGTRQDRRRAPDAERLVARAGRREDRGRDIGEVARNRARDLGATRVRHPLLGAVDRPHQAQKLVAPRRQRAASRVEAGVRGGAAPRCLVPDVRGALGQQQAGERFEHLDDVDGARLQRRHVLDHRPAGHATDAGGIDAGQAQVVLQAEPGRRHFAHRGERRPMLGPPG